MKRNYDELIEQNEASFPDNNSGEITEVALRDFHTDLLDSAALETDWTEVSSDLSSGLSLGGSITIQKCKVKRTGDVVLMYISAGLIITTSSFTGVTFTLNETIFDIGAYAGCVCVFISNSGKMLQLTCGDEQISFTTINPTAVQRDGFDLFVTFPYIT
jgi:hypothetical protein